MKDKSLDEIDNMILDSFSNHTGEFANGWIFKSNFDEEQLTDILSGIVGCKRFKQQILALKSKWQTEVRIEALQWALNDYNMPDTDTKSNLEHYIKELGDK